MSERIDLENGKYTVVIDGGHIQILRNGEPWVGQEPGGFIASKAWIAAAYELQELRDKVAKLQDATRVISPEELEEARLMYLFAAESATNQGYLSERTRNEQGLQAALQHLGIEVRS